MKYKSWCSIEEVLYWFSRSFLKFKGYTGQENHRFWPALRVSGLQLQFEFTDVFGMIHKAWRSIEGVSYWFSRSFVKFLGHTGRKMKDSNPIWVIFLGRSRLSNPSDLPCSRSSIKFEGNMGWKIDDLNPIWVRLQGRSQLSNPSDLPCYVCILQSFFKLFFLSNSPFHTEYFVLSYFIDVVLILSLSLLPWFRISLNLWKKLICEISQIPKIFGLILVRHQSDAKVWDRCWSGDRLNIWMSSYRYRDPHVKDQTVSWPSNL